MTLVKALRERKKGKENSWSSPQSQRIEGEEKESPVREGLEGSKSQP